MSNVVPFPDVDWDFDVPIRDVPKVILSGLRSAGVTAAQGKVWRGKYPTTLDLVIDIACPAGHLSQDRMTFAKVRLLVDPREGTLTVHRDDDLGNGCPHCDQHAIDRWLVTCQGHQENGHPDHNPGWISVWDFPDATPDEVVAHIIPGGDEGRCDDSPMGCVFEAMSKAERESKARWRLAHPDLLADQLRETFGVDHEEFVQSRVANVLAGAKATLRTGTKRVGSTEVVIEGPPTVESVAEWLAEQDVPSTLGQNATWDRVKQLPDCPTQALVRDAQAKRRTAD